MAPSIWAVFTGTRRRYSATKWISDTRNAAMIGRVRILSGMAMPAKATIGTQTRFSSATSTPKAFGLPSQFSQLQGEFALLVGRQAALDHAGSGASAS